MPSHTKPFTTAGVLLGGALVLAFSAPLRAQDEMPDTGSTPSAPASRPEDEEVEMDYLPVENEAATGPSVSITVGPSPDQKRAPVIRRTPARRPVAQKAAAKKPVAKTIAANKAPTRPVANSVAQARLPRVSKANKARAWPFVEKGARLLKRKKYAEALNAYRTGVRYDPTNPYALEGIADSLAILKRPVEAEAAYRRALTVAPGKTKPKLQRGLANVLVPQKKYAEAITLLKSVVAKDSKDFASTLQLGQLYTWTKRYSDADALYRRASALAPDNAGLWKAWGDSLVVNRPVEAETAYRRALALAPGNINVQRALANSLVPQKKYTQAISAFRSVLAKDSKDFASTYRLAQIYTWSKRYKDADALYRRALSLSPGNAEVWTDWGESLSYGREPGARDAFAGALRIARNNVRALNGLGNLYLWNGEFKDAEETFRRVLRLDRRNLKALSGMGDTLAFSKRQAEAVPYYQRALVLAPNNLSIQLGLGRALIQSKREEAGLPYIRRVLAREPRNTQARQLLADAQTGINPSDRNILVNLQKVLASQTKSEDKADTWLRIARYYDRAGNWAEEEAAYRKAASLAPGDSEIAISYAQALIREDEWEAAKEVVDVVTRREPGNTRALILQVVVESKAGSPERATALANRLMALDVTTPEDTLALANAMRAVGNTADARTILERLANQNSNDPETMLQVATAIRDAGLYDLAQPIFTRLLLSQPADIEARFNFAEMLLWQNRFEEAEKQTAILLENAPNNVNARVLAATIALRRDDLDGIDEAGTEAEAALKIDENNINALILKTQVLSLRQNYSEAAEAAQKALNLDSTNLGARLALARNLYYARQIPQSIEQYRELIKRAPAEVSVKLELAKVFLDLERLSDAEEIYREVLENSDAILPPIAKGKITRRNYARVSPTLKPFKGELFYSTAKAAKGSTPSLRRVAASTTIPNVPSASNVPTTPAIPAPEDSEGEEIPAGASTPFGADDTGLPVLEIPDAPDAEGTPEDFTPVPALEIPSNEPPPTAGAPLAPTEDQEVTANIGLGEVRRRQGRFDEAIEFFSAALASDPANTVARVGLARSLRGKTDYSRALTEANLVLETDKNNLDARVLRAQLLADTGQAQEASAELDALVDSLPEKPTLETYLDVAGGFVALGNYDAAIQILKVAEEDYPNRVEPQRALGETYNYAKRWDEALVIWDQLIARNPNDANAVVGKARVYNYSSRVAEAEAVYRRALELDPNNYLALVELADVLARQSEYPDSIELYRQAIEQNPNDLKARVELARVLRYNRRFEESETILNGVIAIDDRYAPAYTERSLARAGLRNYETAVADARRALEITPRDLNARLGLAEVLSYAQQYDESIRLYRSALESDPTNTKARVQYSAALSYAGRHDEALTQLNAVLKDNPQNLDARIIRADTLGRSGRTTEAITEFQAVLRTEPRNVRARVGLAESYVYARKYDLALKTYDVLIAAEPENIPYRIARGRTLGFARRYQQAINTLRPIVVANPTNVNARLALAEAMTNSGIPSQRRQAIAQYQTVLRQDAQNVDARIGLGRVYSYGGQYKQAERELNTVLRQYPDNRDARFALAESQRFSGDVFNSRDNYERVLQRDPTNIGSQIGLATVRRATSIGVTAAYSQYTDTNGVRFGSYSLGAQVPTRAGTFGLVGERGSFRDDGVELRRRALSLILARRFGPLQARLMLSKVNYSGAPSRNLYDLGLQRQLGIRKRVYFTIAKREILESLEAVQDGITARVIQGGGEFPIGDHIDTALSVTHYRYSDNNSRTTIAPSLYYRFRRNNPTLRVGIGYTSDNTREDDRDYYTPQGYSAFSALIDYYKDTGRLRYGASASIPFTGRTGDDNRPAKTLFGNVVYEANDFIDLFLNGGIVRSPDFDSNQFNGGVTVYF